MLLFEKYDNLTEDPLGKLKDDLMRDSGFYLAKGKSTHHKLDLVWSDL